VVDVISLVFDTAGVVGVMTMVDTGTGEVDEVLDIVVVNKSAVEVNNALAVDGCAVLVFKDVGVKDNV
jgi:hypothetical protein